MTPPTPEAPRARPDPKADAFPAQELVYQSIQRLWSAWAQRRYRAELERVESFCLFVGYPRSGHSVVGAMLNAHRHAVVSHELNAPSLVLAGCGRHEVFARILARAAWFNLRGNRSNYQYQVPNRWQGRFEALRVLGDKGGGWLSQSLRDHPDLLRRIHDTVGVPVRLIHVVRNPYDNIAAISRWHRLSLDESISFYFAHCETTGSLADREEVVTVRHEALIGAPEEMLSRLCAHLGLEVDGEYLTDCASIVFDRPTGSRRAVEWRAAQIEDVGRRARSYAFLDGYEFAPTEPAGTRAGRAAGAGYTPSAIERFGAWLSPRVRSPAMRG